MKITPLEIRQKTFERSLRGYDKDEVRAFLQTLSIEWERMLDEIKETRKRIDSNTKEINKLREVENSIFKTLKTAETTGANVMDQAHKSADLLLQETQIKAEKITQEARQQANHILNKARTISTDMLEEMEKHLKSLSKDYRRLEHQRDNLTVDLNRLANDIIERTNRIQSSVQSFNPNQHMTDAKQAMKKNIIGDSSLSEDELSKHQTEPHLTAKEESKTSSPPLLLHSRSFFDNLDER